MLRIIAISFLVSTFIITVQTGNVILSIIQYKKTIKNKNIYAKIRFLLNKENYCALIKRTALFKLRVPIKYKNIGFFQRILTNNIKRSIEQYLIFIISEIVSYKNIIKYIKYILR
jgi:hypothetical protein